MFKITPVNDKEYQKEICEKVGGEFKPDYFAYAMTDIETGEIMGYAQFELLSDYAILSDLREPKEKNDFEAMFILGRQTLNFIDLCGVHRAISYKSAADERLLHAIGFRLNNDKYEINLEGMFDGKCDGHTVKL
jgi:hypothetical protein